MLNKIKNIVIASKKKYSLGAHEFRNHEWLFDVHWYNDNDHYCSSGLSMVAESELSKNRIEDTSGHTYSAIKFDFQKLLTTNAELRLLVFRIKNLEILYNQNNGLSDYFAIAIKTYKCLAKGSKFLFVCYLGESIFYKELVK